MYIRYLLATQGQLRPSVLADPLAPQGQLGHNHLGYCFCFNQKIFFAYHRLIILSFNEFMAKSSPQF